jgi:glucose-1-phosphate thymidylyltransferase
MKGIILAGGVGSRLLPLTEKINKHLLPIYNKPMIFYPIEFFKKLGIDEILIVTNRENAGITEDILGNGSRFGVDLTYKVQEYEEGKETGIAKALELAKNFVNGERMLVQLADNIFSMSNAEVHRLCSLIENPKSEYSAYVFIKHISNPTEFGVPVFSKGKIIRIEEKSKKPKSNFVVTGLYSYDSSVFDKIKEIKPSPRGEYEITEVNNLYIRSGILGYFKINCEWVDAGTFEGLYTAIKIVREGLKHKDSIFSR